MFVRAIFFILTRVHFQRHWWDDMRVSLDLLLEHLQLLPWLRGYQSLLVPLLLPLKLVRLMQRYWSKLHQLVSAVPRPEELPTTLETSMDAFLLHVYCLTQLRSAVRKPAGFAGHARAAMEEFAHFGFHQSWRHTELTAFVCIAAVWPRAGPIFEQTRAG